MRESILISLLMLIYFSTFGQKNNVAEFLIPQPVSVIAGSGHFILNNETKIHILSEDSSAKRVGDFLSNRLSLSQGHIVSTVVNPKNPVPENSIQLSLLSDSSLGDEGYKLNVTVNWISIHANKPAGLFYGMQTLFQLMPKEIESKKVVKNINWEVPVCTITDNPRFGWRGLLFDVSRHFFTKDEVKRFIDQMVKYKYNLLHLHLTDDQGWRIEIEGLPMLTEIGAWNVQKVGNFGKFSQPSPNKPRNYGGFYTQDDIRDLVEYAKARFVDILPEIDVPGHSLAAVTSYPEISCTSEANEYKVNSGEPFMDWSQGHPPIALVDNTLCPGNEKAYAFLDKVMTQIAGLFPFEYIHIGGDECPRNFWENSDSVKALMQREGLKDMDEVQSYFIKRLEKIVESKGKKAMGWDEIQKGGLAPNAAVMSRWSGSGMEAGKMKHKVVNNDAQFTYLDYKQGDPIIEPYGPGTLRLKRAYQFEPVFDGVDPEYILGGQANLWTEQVYNMRQVEYMVWPRAMAIAEAVWSPKVKRNWNDFSMRVEKQFKRFEEAQIKYAPSIYNPIFKASKIDSTQIRIELSTEITELDIYYSFDNSFPDNFYPKYMSPLIPPEDAVMLRVITYRGNKPIGRMVSMPIAELQKRIGN